MTRQLGFLSATAVVIASMIGAGVFTTSGFLLADLGSPWIVLLAWCVGGIQAALGALCYGALARRIPESGGEYIFLSRTLHPSAGYLAGWISLLVGFSAPLAAAAFAFGKYTGPWIPALDARHLGTLLILLFGLVHALHVGRGAQLQNLSVIVKVCLILVLIGYAMPRLDFQVQSETAPAPFSVKVFAVSLVWISFSYSGWNAAVYVAGEVKNAERVLPRALLVGTGLVMLLYLALNAVFVFSAPPDQLAGRLDVGRIAAESIGGPWLGNAVAALIALALLTSVSSLIMTGPRVYAQMARDGYLPRLLRGDSGPPRFAIGIQLVIALVLLWTATFEDLLTYIGFTLMISTAATVVGLIVLRKKEGPALPVAGWPWIPIIFLAGAVAIAAFSILQRPGPSLTVLAILGIGWIMWFVLDRRRPASA
jgi:basic amino acid/polyamine antiporter, APA family